MDGGGAGVCGRFKGGRPEIAGFGFGKGNRGDLGRTLRPLRGLEGGRGGRRGCQVGPVCQREEAETRATRAELRDDVD